MNKQDSIEYKRSHGKIVGKNLYTYEKIEKYEFIKSSIFYLILLFLLALTLFFIHEVYYKNRTQKQIILKLVNSQNYNLQYIKNSSIQIVSELQSSLKMSKQKIMGKFNNQSFFDWILQVRVLAKHQIIKLSKFMIQKLNQSDTIQNITEINRQQNKEINQKTFTTTSKREMAQRSRQLEEIETKQIEQQNSQEDFQETQKIETAEYTAAIRPNQ